jgi:glycosyltransferase involved in cell wall biosynthesis
MNKPLVSIIIPVYNGENYLREAIESSLSQTYSNIEVIVVNDGSRDQGATERIAQSYGDRIRYFSKENGGVATALNLAIRNMNGEYFSWLSHDDIYYPEKIEKQLEALYTDGDMTKVVNCDYDLLDVDAQTVTHVLDSTKYPKEQLTNSVFPVLHGLIHGCGLFIHKSHFERVGTFDESLITTQDYDLWFRILRYQRSIYVNETLVISRLHSTQVSRNLTVFHPERDELHIHFVEAMTDEEMRNIYGSAYNFYFRMYCYFKGAQMPNSARFANQKLQEADVPDNLSESLSTLQEYIKKLSNGKAERICIFSAGEYGVRLYHELRSKLINVHSFSDNNPQKWGYLFDNISCIPPQQLDEEKDRTLVIVANRSPAEIVKDLKSKGYPFVITKQELDGILIEVPPAKWLTALDDIEGIDYSSKEILLLVERFSQTIYDICKYYQDRTK